MMKAIYSGFTSPYWKLVAEKLARESNWQPVYWVGDPVNKTEVERSFPDVIFHPIVDAVKGVRPVEYVDVQLDPLDSEALNECAPYQALVYRMMDRIDALGSFNFNDRVRLFHNVLQYWRMVLDDLRPDIVLFSVIPHMIFDYMLYELCRQRGVKTLMFESTPLRGLSFLMEEFDQPSPTQKLFQQLETEGHENDVMLSGEMEAFIQSLQGDYKDVPDYIRRDPKEKLYQGVSSSSKTFFEKLFDIKNYTKYFNKQQRIWLSRVSAPNNYVKQPGKKLEDSRMSLLQKRIFYIRSRQRMRRLSRHYETLAGDVDLNKPFIYVALSYQPERTTSPMASIYVEQFLMVDLLAKTVPTGWQIYVKEHPTQFTPAKFFRAQSGRTFDFYDDMAALPNVCLVPLATASYELIDHAQAVAATTGTVGWEAVLRGKPVLLFGHPWYRGCEGSFQIDTYDSCLLAINAIADGFEIDRLKLRLFAYALEQTAIDASVEGHLQIEGLSDDEIASRLTQAIQKYQF
jgi:hypothetical protein